MTGSVISGGLGDVGSETGASLACGTKDWLRNCPGRREKSLALLQEKKVAERRAKGRIELTSSEPHHHPKSSPNARLRENSLNKHKAKRIICLPANPHCQNATYHSLGGRNRHGSKLRFTEKNGKLSQMSKCGISIL